MRFNSEDIKRGFKQCHCGYKHILQSGTDYHDECWVLCDECKCYVVDEGKEKIKSL